MTAIIVRDQVFEYCKDCTGLIFVIMHGSVMVKPVVKVVVKKMKEYEKKKVTCGR